MYFHITIDFASQLFLGKDTYGTNPEITITYVPTEAAKIVFDYVIHDGETGEEIATGRSVQVFLNEKRELLWSAPEFYESWKKKWNVNG